MKIVFIESNEVVREAVQKANALLTDTTFLQAIRDKDRFDLSTATPAVIADLIASSELEFSVELFYPNSITQRWKYRNTLGYTDADFPNTVFLNVKRLNRGIAEIVGTIIHECIHALDDANDEYTFGHGNNSPRDKDNTAPYWIGNLAVKCISGDEHATVSFSAIDQDLSVEITSNDEEAFFTIQRAWEPIVGKGFTVQEFAIYCAGLSWNGWRPQFITVHNTASPTLAQRPTGFNQTHMKNFENYYRNQLRWSAGPHLFIDDFRIWVFTPLNKPGVHSPSWNQIALGLEMLGNYETESFDSGRGLAVRKNAIAAIAILYATLGLEPNTIRLHKEDTATTHRTCPGKNVSKSALIQEIERMMNPMTRMEEHLS